MNNLHRPMKACALLPPNVEHSDIVIMEALEKCFKINPVHRIASIKKDGIRAVRTSDLFSCQMFLIPNVSIRRRSMKLPSGFDCELFNPSLSYDEIESIVMTGKTEHPDSDKIQFHCIDLYHPVYTFEQRIFNAIKAEQLDWTDVVTPDYKVCGSAKELFDYFIQAEQLEGEGICFRTFNSPYKQGRSTMNEQYLIKICRYVRTEVVIIGFEEQMFNNNRKKRNPLGMMDRSSYKENMVGKNTLGAFLVRDTDRLEFRVGTGVGLTDVKRQQIWDSREKWIGKSITIKHKPHGMKIKPRSPIYIGKREEGY